MKLHYSQTTSNYPAFDVGFQYLMKLHYSQTIFQIVDELNSFSTLWNYTTLKQTCGMPESELVSVPYEITLLSNLK